VSAANASRAWELRCAVREALIGFLRENYPEFLPRLRAEIDLRGAGQGAATRP
jgi:hypothetical protein